MKKSTAELVDQLITVNVKLLVIGQKDGGLENRKKKLISDIVNDTGQKTMGDILDSLSTTVIKCYMAQDDQAAAYKRGDMAEAAEMGQIVMELNAKRNQYMRELDILLGMKNETVTPKIFNGERW